MSASWHGLCTQCRSGWAPGDKKTFSKNCPGCQRKLAAGLRTGLEPAPIPLTKRAKRLTPEAFERDVVAKNRAMHAKRRAYYFSSVPGREMP